MTNGNNLLIDNSIDRFDNSRHNSYEIYSKDKAKADDVSSDDEEDNLIDTNVVKKKKLLDINNSIDTSIDPSNRNLTLLIPIVHDNKPNNNLCKQDKKNDKFSFNQLKIYIKVALMTIQPIKWSKTNDSEERNINKMIDSLDDENKNMTKEMLDITTANNKYIINWCTHNDTEEYNEKASCFINQYNKFYLEDKGRHYINGINTFARFNQAFKEQTKKYIKQTEDNVKKMINFMKTTMNIQKQYAFVSKDAKLKGDEVVIRFEEEC
ncbi:hypothetical protein H8356DRAFT_1354626 [Neocallimastix lanati (nom. inval.)]|nr:hypothetical protein H8356DRAFT_1354626 [Neocallimastix sp. JGI-2020a]